VWLRTAAAAPVSCLLVVYCAVVAALLTFLGGYHAYLLAINQTTYEHMRSVYWGQGSNPFNQGLANNAIEVCCFPRSLLPLLQASTDLEAGVGTGEKDTIWLRGGSTSTARPKASSQPAQPASLAAARALEQLDRQEAERRQRGFELDVLRGDSAGDDATERGRRDERIGAPPNEDPPPSPEAEPWDARDSFSSGESEAPAEYGAAAVLEQHGDEVVITAEDVAVDTSNVVNV
jgi:hypothetical protein